MNQRKCPACGTWNEGSNKTCQACGAIVDEKVVREEQKKRMTQAELAQRLKEQPDWLNRLFGRLKNSKNPFGKLAFYVLNAMWMVYFGLLLFVAWLTFLAAG